MEGIVTMHINLGSSSEAKRAEIYKLIASHHVDIAFLLDCKVTTSNLNSFKYHARSRLPSGMVFQGFPTAPNAISKTVFGGAIVTISKRLKNFSAKQLVPLGALIQVTAQLQLISHHDF